MKELSKKTIFVLQEASDNFNLGTIINFDKLESNFNNIFLVRFEKENEYIFKIYSKDIKKNLKSELIYLQRLEEYDFPAIYYLKNKFGEALFEFEDLIILVQPKGEGVIPKFNKKVAFEIGKNLGKLHNVPHSSLPKRENWLDENVLSSNIRIIEDKFPKLGIKYRDEFKKLQGFEYKFFPKTIIHGDLYENNCLFNKNILESMIDWEGVSIGPSVLDLSTGIYNFCFIDNKFNLELYEELINGYKSNHNITNIEHENLCLAVKYVGLNLSAWRLVKFKIEGNNLNKAIKFKKYWEMGLDKFFIPAK